MLTRRPTVLYAGIALLIALWSAGFFYFASAVVPVDYYLISYYVTDYSAGFVRRGLAGEIVGSVSADGFFRNAYVMRWVTTAVYLLALSGLAFKLLYRVRSHRRWMIALLLPVLPFGVPYAVYSGRPDLLGAAALIALCLTLSAVRKPRWALLSCGTFGVLVAVLALMHEGIAFEYGLGVALAVLVLIPGIGGRKQWWCAALAIGPGVLTALGIAVFARRDVSAQVCATVPHRLIEMPFASMKSPSDLFGYLINDAPVLSDYHDWVCGWYLTTEDHSVADGIREVAAVGAVALIGSVALGLVVVAVTLSAVSYFSGVSFRDFVAQLNGRFVLPAVGLALMIPLFLTAVDWTRWLLIVAFNIVVVFMLYANRKSEIDQTPPRRAVTFFPLVVLGFMLIPLGLAPGGGPMR